MKLNKKSIIFIQNLGKFFYYSDVLFFNKKIFLNPFKDLLFPLTNMCTSFLFLTSICLTSDFQNSQYRRNFFYLQLKEEKNWRLFNRIEEGQIS